MEPSNFEIGKEITLKMVKHFWESIDENKKEEGFSYQDLSKYIDDERDSMIENNYFTKKDYGMLKSYAMVSLEPLRIKGMLTSTVGKKEPLSLLYKLI